MRLILVLIVLSMAACAGDEAPTSRPPSSTTTTAAEAECSATGLERPNAQEQLPEPVATTRDRIIDLALACDLEALASLAMEGDFTYSFGGGEDPAAFWRDAEGAGDEPMAILVRLLGLEPVVDDTVLWPRAYARQSWDDVTDDEKAELRQIYSEDELAQFESFGSYAGYRVGISSDGDWAFFVAGD